MSSNHGKVLNLCNGVSHVIVKVCVQDPQCNISLLSLFSGWISATVLIIGVLAFLQKRKMRITGRCKIQLFHMHTTYQSTYLTVQCGDLYIGCKLFIIIYLHYIISFFFSIKPRLADPSFKPCSRHILAAVEDMLNLLEIRYSSPLFRLRSANAVQVRPLKLVYSQK